MNRNPSAIISHYNSVGKFIFVVYYDSHLSAHLLDVLDFSNEGAGPSVDHDDWL